MIQQSKKEKAMAVYLYNHFTYLIISFDCMAAWMEFFHLLK